MSREELVEVAQAMTAGGIVDLLSISIGTGQTSRTTAVFVPGDALPENVSGALGGRMRSATGVPVLVAGRILNAEMAERALTENGVDLVATTRALIADPDLPRKSASGITPRPCISLNEGCIGRLYQGLPMWCSVSPGIREPELDLVPEASAHAEASQPDGPVGAPARRIVVIGGGVAGAEAAHRAAERGSQVVLLEPGDLHVLADQLRQANLLSQPDHRHQPGIGDQIRVIEHHVHRGRGMQRLHPAGAPATWVTDPLARSIIRGQGHPPPHFRRVARNGSVYSGSGRPFDGFAARIGRCSRCDAPTSACCTPRQAAASKLRSRPIDAFSSGGPKPPGSGRPRARAQAPPRRSPEHGRLDQPAGPATWMGARKWVDVS